MNRLARIFVMSSIGAHALGSLAAGSLNPGSWPPLVLMATIFLIAPLLALGIAVIDGAL